MRSYIGKWDAATDWTVSFSQKERCESPSLLNLELSLLGHDVLGYYAIVSANHIVRSRTILVYLRILGCG